MAQRFYLSTESQWENNKRFRGSKVDLVSVQVIFGSSSRLIGNVGYVRALQDAQAPENEVQYVPLSKDLDYDGLVQRKYTLFQ